MKIAIFLVALLLMINLNGEPPMNYYELALLRCNSSNNWTIHGLWPQYTKKTWPEFCNPKRYGDFTDHTLNQKTKYGTLAKQLPLYWITCHCMSEDECFKQDYHFWTHEWKKHGTCQPLNAEQFFWKVLQLYFKAQSENWYGCCNSAETQCLIPLNLDYSFRGCY